LACGGVAGFLIDGFTAAMFAAFVLETGLTAITLFVRGKITNGGA
jgi:hypothetical protein